MDNLGKKIHNHKETQEEIETIYQDTQENFPFQEFFDKWEKEPEEKQKNNNNNKPTSTNYTIIVFATLFITIMGIVAHIYQQSKSTPDNQTLKAITV